MRRIFLGILSVVAGVFIGRMLYGQTQLKQLNDELVQIAAKVGPSVVQIEFEGAGMPQIFRREGGGEGGGEGEAPGGHREVRIVGNNAGEGGNLRGSGIIMTSDGFILTALRRSLRPWGRLWLHWATRPGSAGASRWVSWRAHSGWSAAKGRGFWAARRSMPDSFRLRTRSVQATWADWWPTSRGGWWECCRVL